LNAFDNGHWTTGHSADCGDGIVEYLDRMDGVDHLDGFHFLAKVSVAGSNPVARSKRSWSAYRF